MDQNGPIIEFKSKNGRIFRSGDHKNLNEEIIVQISDPLGINLTRELGHSIILKDLTNDNSFDITDSFVYNNNSITTGEISINNYIENEIDINSLQWGWDNPRGIDFGTVISYNSDSSNIFIIDGTIWTKVTLSLWMFDQKFL